jgi:hypothetical protein
MKHLSIIFVFLVLFLLVSTSIAQTHWTKEILFNPVLSPGPAGAWDESWVRKPTVIFDGTTYHMWYVGSSPHRIGYAISSDGINWTKYNDPTTTDPLFTESDPVLNPGQPGEWDSEEASAPSVILLDTTYHMWYRGKDHTVGNGPASIGHAKSTDRIHWEKDTLNNPVLTPGPAGSWDEVWIGYQSKVLFDGTLYHMWYEGWGGIDDYVQIGHATAPHPDSAWTKDPNNPVLSFGALGSWDNPRMDGPSVVYDGNIYHMWYSAGIYFNWQIGHATAPHPDSAWTKDTLNPVLTPGPADWDSTWVGFCSVIDSGGSKYKMWYSGGNAAGGGRIGYAYSPVVGIKVLDANLLNDYVLQQNYPNPFNPTTTIGFSLPKSEFVTLKVYNILGEEVATLVSEKLAAGSYKYEWDASRPAGMASGVYLYRIQAENYIEVKKMILLR